jgi:C4-dicarboxylate-specific signal transduction histidine kinase/CheY-like chemotaxis protein
MPTDAEIAVEPAGRLTARAVRTGILTRLFALVVVALLPALAIQAYNEIAGRETREAEVREDALRLAQFASGELDRIVENGHAVLAALANFPAIRNFDAAGCTAYVASLQKSFPQYSAIGAIDLKGHVFCASIPIPPDSDATDREFFRRARDTGQFAVGEYVVGRLVNKPVLPLCLPFYDSSGHIAGVVYVSLDLDWLARYFVETRPFSKKAALAIADRNGTILARIPDNANYVGKSFSPEYDTELFAKQPGTSEIVGIDGAVRIVGFVPASTSLSGLYVGVGMAKADAFTGINDATRFGFLLIAIGLATGLIVAWLGGRYFISRPIDRLAQAAAQWGQGNFAARTGLKNGRSELTELGQTFDAMAGQLHQQQQQNADLLATLESRVEERTSALETSNRELRGEMERRERAEDTLRHVQKIEALGQLTGGVAHDFNNILQVILASLDAVQRRLARNGSITSGDGGDHLKAAARSAERAATLTQQLLAFARRQPLAPETVDLNRLVRGMSELLRRTLGEIVDIETVLAGGLWPVSVDVSQLENALVNLAVNARDAMPAGGKLTIETANAFLDEDYSRAHEEVRAGQYVLLAMTDSGAGMTKEVLEQAFDPFFTTKEVGQGTGLGLSQVYGFIKQSGGHVKIYSQPGDGTTVKMYLPRLVSANADALGAAPRDEATALGRESEVILVVEDEEDVRAATVAMLCDLGYSVIEAADGHAALRLLATHHGIRLLFTDIGLPGGLTGRQLADQAAALRPGLRVLYTTGYARNAVVHHGVLDPGVELLVKPFNYAALASRIRALLDG